MNTLDDFKQEYDRICDTLKIKVLNHTTYRAHCRDGYSPHWLRKKFGLTFNQAKEKMGLELATSINTKGCHAASKKKIYCARGEGDMISIDNCVPMCNPEVCIPCPNKQMQNVRASDDTLSPEEEREMRHEGAYQSHMVEAMEGGYIDQN